MSGNQFEGFHNECRVKVPCRENRIGNERFVSILRRLWICKFPKSPLLLLATVYSLEKREKANMNGAKGDTRARPSHYHIF